MMSLLLYLAVLLVSLSSVLFGLGWLSTPEPQYQAPTAQMASHAPPGQPANNNARAALSPVYPAAPDAPAGAKKPAVAATTPPAAAPEAAGKTAERTAKGSANDSVEHPVARAAESPADRSTVSATATADGGTVGAEPTDGGPQAAPSPACDVRACTAAYRSFRASDCTYQPFNGPRRLCTKGSPPGRAQAEPAAAGPAGINAQAQATPAQAASSCNIAACEAAYRSFDPSDCTYQPYDGPRRLCTK